MEFIIAVLTFFGFSGTIYSQEIPEKERRT
jgi:hypothetical protein